MKYMVVLKPEEQRELIRLSRDAKTPPRVLTRARILLKADEGFTDEEVAGLLQVHPATVWGIRKRFSEGGLRAAIDEGRRPGRTSKLSMEQKERLIAVARGEAPEGYTHWSLRLLAEKAVQMGFTESICHETVRKILKKARRGSGLPAE